MIGNTKCAKLRKPDAKRQSMNIELAEERAKDT
jgi:hypothetical protein